jgi:hypothetical protein
MSHICVDFHRGRQKLLPMRHFTLVRRVFVGVLVMFSAALSSLANSAAAQRLIERTVADVMAEFPTLKTNQLAITLTVLPKDKPPEQASYRGNEPIYPASVVKLFYLVAAHRWMEDGRFEDTAELRRAMRDMIVDSGKEPTH